MHAYACSRVAKLPILQPLFWHLLDRFECIKEYAYICVILRERERKRERAKVPFVNTMHSMQSSRLSFRIRVRGHYFFLDILFLATFFRCAFFLDVFILDALFLCIFSLCTLFLDAFLLHVLFTGVFFLKATFLGNIFLTQFRSSRAGFAGGMHAKHLS